jgi:hypothetical protein
MIRLIHYTNRTCMSFLLADNSLASEQQLGAATFTLALALGVPARGKTAQLREGQTGGNHERQYDSYTRMFGVLLCSNFATVAHVFLSGL